MPMSVFRSWSVICAEFARGPLQMPLDASRERRFFTRFLAQTAKVSSSPATPMTAITRFML